MMMMERWGVGESCIFPFKRSFENLTSAAASQITPEVSECLSGLRSSNLRLLQLPPPLSLKSDGTSAVGRQEAPLTGDVKSGDGLFA